MATWNELFKSKKHILEFPQTEVFKFIRRLESEFDVQPLAIWDQCCGAGRNTLLIAEMGHRAFASDVSSIGIDNLHKWSERVGLSCQTAVADMTVNPWKEGQRFHGVVCWDSLHHNTIDRIRDAVQVIRQSLVTRGLFLTTLISTKSGGHERGREIEENTFISEEGLEAGVPHHYFDYEEIRKVFMGWGICIVAELVATYIETEPRFYEKNPFSYTKWNLLLRKAP